MTVDCYNLLAAGPRLMRLPPSLTSLSVSGDHDFDGVTTVDDVLENPSGPEKFCYLASPQPYNDSDCCHAMNAVISFLQPIHSSLRRLDLNCCDATQRQACLRQSPSISAFSPLWNSFLWDYEPLGIGCRRTSSGRLHCENSISDVNHFHSRTQKYTSIIALQIYRMGLMLSYTSFRSRMKGFYRA